MKNTLTCTLIGGLIAGTACTTLTTAAEYDYRHRSTGSTDVSLRLNYMEEESYSGRNGTSLEADDTMGLGFGFMYNSGPNWAFGASFDGSSTDYIATGFENDLIQNRNFRYDNEFDSFSINFDTIYYFSDKQFTPFVTASLGWTEVDTNIASGPPQDYCWWDWWGYYCGLYVPTREEGGFNYKVGLGFRYDFSRYFAIRGSYSYSEIDIDVAGDKPSNNIWRLELVAPM